MPTAVIITAIPVETRHVLAHLSDVTQETRRERLFHVGRFTAGGPVWTVAVGEAGAGNSSAALLTERAIAAFTPELALFVGIAGGIKDVSIGDVVVADGIYGYESGKVEADGFLVRPRELRGSRSLLALAGGVLHRDDWRRRLRAPGGAEPPKIVVGRIAAGEKLVASAQSELRRFLHRAYNDAKALEMEGYGFLEAVDHNEGVRGLVIRGISDLLDNKGVTDAGGGQERAADSAAAVAFELLSRLAPQSGGDPSGAAATLAPFSTIPERPWLADRSPPGALLRADHGIVPFHGREAEQRDVVGWCLDDPAPLAARLYTGPGGMGKTRLFLELCRRLAADGWRTGFLDPAQAPMRPDGWVGHLPSGDDQRLLVVVDYAETRQEAMIALLTAAAQRSAGRVRVVLLARAAGDWWELLKSGGDGVGELLSGPATRWLRLRPLALSEAERRRSYRLALGNFADTLGRPAPEEASFDVMAGVFDRVLLLHMRALAAIDGVPVQDEDGILDWMLRREQRHWSDHARMRGLPPTLLDGIRQAVAVLTLAGGAPNPAMAQSLLSAVPLLRDQPRHILHTVGKLLRNIYPGDGEPGNHWIIPLQPDLLGEHLVQRELDRDADTLLDLVLGPRASAG